MLTDRAQRAVVDSTVGARLRPEGCWSHDPVLAGSNVRGLGGSAEGLGRERPSLLTTAVSRLSNLLRHGSGQGAGRVASRILC